MEEASGPADVKTRPAAETTTLPCAICRRQFSRYTCPRCNIPYCSLTCFRSESHAECSETFYRKEIESDVRGDASKSAEQRHKTLELLKRFEEDSMDDDILELDSDDSDEIDADLESRLKGVDLEAASCDDLWAALTPAEREKFTKALRDPSSELAQQLLSSEELENVRTEPWWEGSKDTSGEQARGLRRAQKRYGKRPAMMQIPAHMTRTPPTPGKFPLLLYNICAVMVAYAYATRYLATSPLTSLGASEEDEARRIVAQLVPFLTDRLSKVVHSTLSAAVTDLLSRFQPDAMPLMFFSILLKDAATLLLPSTVVELSSDLPAPQNPTSSGTSSPTPSASSPIDDLSTHPSARALLALSDLFVLFKMSEPSKLRHVAHKLTFYAAYVVGVPPVLLRTLAAELTGRAESMAKGSGDPFDAGRGQDGSQGTEKDQRTVSSSREDRSAKIIELE
ncbi:hypothetical protein DAEQUDRAFT_763498 [Daedalea quercina L-15889]|uniref:HIT-type domain-containing protein n=1 Tax=Daedalea quercina L-15889 TaxID=1314783 RepID=A0A165SI13_9APHY|nr:hypothetical protein DAEQUDRAFT_763498 [Daedalea quercina L-15889]